MVNKYENVKILLILILIFLGTKVVDADYGYQYDPNAKAISDVINRGGPAPPDPRTLNAWLIKTDSNGDMLWKRTFGGASADETNYVQQTSDGGYILTGYTQSYGEVGKIWLIKTDVNGNEQWNRTLRGSPRDYSVSSHYVQQTKDGGYIMVGRNYNGEGLIIKTDSKGYQQWNNITRGRSISNIQQTLDGGYVFAQDQQFKKIDSKGNLQWKKTFCYPIGCEYGDADLNYVKVITDGGYIVIGEKDTHTSRGIDLWLFKTDTNGNEKWNKSFEGIDIDGVDSVQLTNDGYIIIGWTSPRWSSLSKPYLIKTDDSGNELLRKKLDRGKYIQQTSDGGYIIATTNDIPKSAELIKTDANGNMQWNKTFKGKWFLVNSMQQTSDGGYIFTGGGYGTALSEPVTTITSAPNLVSTPIKTSNAQTTAPKTPSFEAISVGGALILTRLAKRKINRN